MFWGPGPIFGLLALVTILQVVDGNKCLTMREEVNPKRVVQLDEHSVNIKFEVSRRVTQRLSSNIMKIFLVEVLGYAGVTIVEKDDQFDTPKVYSRLSGIITDETRIIDPETMVNMEVWVPPQMDTTLFLNRHYVKECGPVAPPGHMGWFIPKRLFHPSDDWLTFAKQETAERFSVDDAILQLIESSTTNPTTGLHYCNETFCSQGMYIPPRCGSHRHKTQPCALLLASHPDVTAFVKDHITSLNLYVKVAWVGPNLRKLSHSISKDYLKNNSSRSLVILHWTPSDVIPNKEEFVPVAFPRCGYQDSNVGCKYETNRLVKLVWASLEFGAKLAYEAIRQAVFTEEMYTDLVSRYNNFSMEKTDEEIACDWLKDNLDYTLRKWSPSNADKNILTVGGIFPITGTTYQAKSIVFAANMAKKAINENETILRDYNLELLASDGQCKSDMVVKSFIDYIVRERYPKLIGVLGPACSETVEPLLGISKHYKTMVISYSAEGSSFNDRKKYPYFFRTIGENKQFKHVYLQLLQRLKWHRVAALMEDGQRYTEYISHTQDLLQANDISFIANIKFPRERESHEMTMYLKDLKQKRAKIIIADVYDEIARQVMCEASNLEMTALQGYVWFLPMWLLPRWYDTDFYNEKRGEQVPCTTEQMTRAINGYLALSHAYFAPDNSIMQEGITVREWRDRYEALCRLRNTSPSNYAGYTYDAMWTYAHAMDQLIKENQSYVLNLHSERTVNRLTSIINKTDFNGVSGRIKFLGGPSRFSVIQVIQFIDNETRVVGNFHLNISEKNNEISGGTLDLNMSAIVWLSGQVPDDGTEPPQKCVLAGLAELLDVTCEVAIITVNIIGFGFLGILLIVGFVIVKKKYDKKVRLHEKYMKSLGIDLLQSDTSGLDKWEIPRDRVVINRKLGEGAFGTVYGGEAFFPEKGWLAVAVKTLKVGSTTDEKLDFLSEVEVMKRFEHKNVIKLLGVCIKCEPVYTVMEFMLYGDLKTYLLARRHLVNDRNYEELEEISSKKLTAMALDVARALSYLAQLKYVHRDVASRNCLINAQRVVKLGDFGMTRPMYENDYYKFNRKGMLPVRWMAPESLGLGIFTPASDVWSYGVLLYEIITFGSFPFQGMSNNQVLEHVKVGNSLTVPKGIKPQLEALIRSCWTVDYKKRPNAPEIVDFLATNPRLLFPCLDVPLASVQLEHTGQLELQLPEKFRKFSVSLNNGGSQLSPGLTPTESIDPPLVSINHEEYIQQRSPLLSAQDNSEPGSLSPLLSTPEPSSGYVQFQQGQDNRNANEPVGRYMNVQPGLGDNVTVRIGSKSNHVGDVQLEERSAFLMKGHDPQHVSYL